MNKIFYFLLIIFLSLNSYAHQPRLNEEGDFGMTKDDPYFINDPELS